MEKDFKMEKSVGEENRGERRGGGQRGETRPRRVEGEEERKRERERFSSDVLFRSAKKIQFLPTSSSSHPVEQSNHCHRGGKPSHATTTPRNQPMGELN